MIQRCGGPGLAREALPGVGHVQIAGKDFDGNHTPEDRIVRNVDSPHATPAEPSLNFITTELSAGLEHRALQALWQTKDVWAPRLATTCQKSGHNYNPIHTRITIHPKAPTHLEKAQEMARLTNENMPTSGTRWR
jgi:hypothetical protein